MESIRLQNFRSYTDEMFEFESGVNIIVGPNASGKTNLLEGVLVACRGNPFRVQDGELITFNQQWSRLDMRSPQSLRTVKIIKNESGLIKKQFIIDGKVFGRLPDRLRTPSTLFEPSHLIMLHGPPEARREYIDSLLLQTEAGYSKTQRDYRRALAQRNTLLKDRIHAPDQLFAWNIRLSELGGRIASSRIAMVERISKDLHNTYCSLAGSKNTKTVLQYKTTCNIGDYSSSLLGLLEASQNKDIERGFTTIGPHRDDITLSFNGHITSEVASRGETRTAVLALKIIEMGLVEDARGQKPIVLLDDVFSELDGKRRRALTDVIKGYQTFITTTDADVVVQHFMDKCHIIPLQVD